MYDKFPILKQGKHDFKCTPSNWKYCENGHIKIVKEQLLMYLNKLDTFVKEFNSNTFFNIGAFICCCWTRKEDTDNADDSGINHGLEGQDVKTHSQLKDVMINILVDIAEIEFIKTLEQKGISNGISKQLFHKLLDQYSHVSTLDNTGNDDKNRDNESKEH